MPKISEEVLTKFSNVQNQIWQTVSITCSEAIGDTLTFGSPLPDVTTTNDLFSEMASPKLIIQFALADQPDNQQVILMTQETFADLAAMAKKVDPIEITAIDENLVADARPLIDAIVQGLCLAVGNIKNEPLVALGLTVRYQIFNFPPSLQKAESVMRTSIAITSNVVNGSLTWIIDGETASSIAGVMVNAEGTSLATAVEDAKTAEINALPDETGSLEILMDIPLEISVELGRVRMMVKDVVDLGSGSIIEIDKAAGEPVDVFVNGRLVARGEVVVIEDNFGVRVTEILSPQERLSRLQDAA
ncbi:MAG: flagellar motor switch protein FliN [Chthonomonas sp.]|nr:flagellar motor switch protein FliN [Chthonomonas sp.]